MSHSTCQDAISNSSTTISHKTFQGTKLRWARREKASSSKVSYFYFTYQSNHSLESINNYALGYFDYFDNLDLTTKVEDEDFVYHIVGNEFYKDQVIDYQKEVVDRAARLAQFD